MDEKEEFLNSYLAIRKAIDTISTDLSKLHFQKMRCKVGCSSCCESISVFEVEFNAIQEQIRSLGIILPKPLFLQRFTKKCRFLVGGRCAIYEFRPIICRTHGLPILYRSVDSHQYELSVCKLNFKGVKPGFFNDENALLLSPFNTQLLLLNQSYLKVIYPHAKDLNKRRNLYELE